MQPATGGGQDAFVSRVNATLTSRLQSTHFGGSGNDVAYAVAIHPTSGDVYIAGSTTSTDLPGTRGAAQAASSGLVAAFVVRFNAALTSRLQTTYLGGGALDIAYAMAIHPTTGEVYVTGDTQSFNWASHVRGAAQSKFGGFPFLDRNGPFPRADCFVSRFNAKALSKNNSNWNNW